MSEVIVQKHCKRVKSSDDAGDTTTLEVDLASDGNGVGAALVMGGLEFVSGVTNVSLTRKRS